MGDNTDEVVSGGGGDDTLNGGGGNDWLSGGDGDDQLDGGEGDDTLTDSSGDDVLTGGAGNDRFEFQFLSGALNAIAHGGEGNDAFFLSAGSGATDRIEVYGDGGDDVFSLSGGTSVADGGEGNDRFSLFGSSVSTTLTLGAGRDVVVAGGYLNRISQGVIVITDFLAGASGDQLDLTEYYASDLLAWDGATSPFVTGHARIVQAGGDALLQVDRTGGGDSWTTLLTMTGVTVSNLAPDNFAGFASDGSQPAGEVFTGTGASDQIVGGAGPDTLNGLEGHDNLNGGIGHDVLNGGDGDDTLDGGPGNDVVSGGAGDDILTASHGHDVVYGDAGRDWISAAFLVGAGGGVDAHGGAGDDTLTVSISEDPTLPGMALPGGALYGDDGDDVISVTGVSLPIDGGAGFDRITIGSTWAPGAYLVTLGSGIDLLTPGAGDYTITITDFASGAGGDMLNLGARLQSMSSNWDGVSDPFTTGHARLVQSGADTLVQIDSNGGGDSFTTFVTMQNVVTGDLLARNFALGLTLIEPSFLPGLPDASISGGAGADMIATRWGNDTLHGLGGDDLLFASGGADMLFGGNGADQMYGGDGDDALSGGADDDLLDGGAGNDTLDGGDGIDTASYAAADGEVTVNLGAAGPQDTFGAGVDALVDVENLTGSAFNDTLIGGNGANHLQGGAGDDWLAGQGGDDRLEGGLGVNILVGGDGVDLASYFSATEGLWVDMNAGVYANTGVWDVFYESIEGVEGGSGADALFGNGLNNRLVGNGGADVILGLGGNDELMGGAGDDWLDGGDGDDLLEGGAGVNILIGGAGLDLASYASAATGLWIDLSAGVYAGDGVWDVFFQSIEGALGGSGNDYMIAAVGGSTLMGGGGDDTLIGGVGDDHILGGDGGDWIVAGAGNDRLDGGAGVDVYTSGTGADIFDLGSAAGWDVAFDFDPVNDRFDLDGNLWLGLVQADWDGDGQNDDTMLGYAGGNFVALNVSGLTLDQWNALVIA